MQEQAIRGHGILRVSVSVYPYLNEPSTHEEWHKELLLPDIYQVESVTLNEPYGTYDLTVSSEVIPEGEDIQITPVYIQTAVENGDSLSYKPHFERIELTRGRQ